jgi:serine/threonine protein kinase
VRALSEVDQESTAQVDLQSMLGSLTTGSNPDPMAALGRIEPDATAQVDLGVLMAGVMATRGASDAAAQSDATAQVDLQTLMAGAMAAGGGALLPGACVGRYQIDALLGKGGMGQVWKAHDTELGRVVALKQLSDKMAQDPDARHVFTEEARALAQANHPNVVSVYDVIAQPTGLTLIMEFVDGEGLDEVIRREGRRIPLRRAAELGVQVLAALHHIHSQGLIHRDVKPGNVLVDRHGVARIMDFGLARDATRMRLQGTLVRGTPWYMAPEQIQGQQLTTATDIYAFGITFFELLTGELPFDREDTGLERLEQTPVRARIYRPEIPQGLDSLIHRCLAASPRERPSALELTRGLLPFISARCDYLPPCILPGWHLPEEETLEGASIPPAAMPYLSAPLTQPELPVVLPSARELHATLPQPPEKLEVVHLNEGGARPSALILLAVAGAMLCIGAAVGIVVVRYLF